MRERLEDYPIGIQVMLRHAGELLERLDRMEMDYRAWQASEDYRVWEASFEKSITVDLLVAPVEFVAPTRAEVARLQWEARLRAESGGEG
jgi:hypothetical protein